MAAPPSPSVDHLTSRPPTRPTVSVLPDRQRIGSPKSPLTPILGRSISSQFGSPGSFRVELEDIIVYELGARHVSAGFAGESRPRATVRFKPDLARRPGDYRHYNQKYASARAARTGAGLWCQGDELYRLDIKSLDLALVQDMLERAVRVLHAEYLQLDQKPRKTVLVVPSLLPTPLVEIALKVLFGHYTQPPSVQILTTPLLACVAAGLRNALVVDVGWEEAVITAVGEYKEVYQRRSARAGKLLTETMRDALTEALKQQSSKKLAPIPFAHVEDVVERMAWCRPRRQQADNPTIDLAKSIPLPEPQSDPVPVALETLAESAECLFSSSDPNPDDDDLPVHLLAYHVLLAVPVDLRALCVSRIVVTGGCGKLPGLKPRLLYELKQIIEDRGWDPVSRYGSATAWHEHVLRERNANIGSTSQTVMTRPERPSDSNKKPESEYIPACQRQHDDINDLVSKKAIRNHGARPGDGIVLNQVRGVETLGAWAGASLIASLRVKAVHEIEREDCLKHGLRDLGPI